MAPPSPPVAAWELGVRLREARERAGFDSAGAAEIVAVTQNYISNVEHGRRRIAEDKLLVLLHAYGIRGRQQDSALSLRRACEGRGWWSDYSRVFGTDMVRFFGFEHGASDVWTYEGNLISGLLQTEDYARAVLSSDSANVRASEIEPRLAARMHRQSRLTGDDPVNLTVLLAESALYQQVGGPRVLAGQLERLLYLVEMLPTNLDVRIIPFTAGAHAALGGSTLHLFSFPSARLVRLAWNETITSLNLVESPERVQQYSAAFGEALGLSADREDSERIIRRAIRHIT